MVDSAMANPLVKTPYHYQVGGSLRLGASSYIRRQADDELLRALLNGEYCYVFNARQMGKSSLRVRMQQQLVEAGKRCASLDMTSIGSERVTPLQWYKGMMVDLLTRFELRGTVDFRQWWQDQEDLSMVQRLRLFIEEILLKSLPEDEIFIFVDEIDSALALDFPVDDFFALVRYCYNQRAENPIYKRLTWSLFGVVSPSDLIRDPQRTPFNVGRSIELKGLAFEDAKVLAQGLEGYDYDPLQLLAHILAWTQGQPFLTQKLCLLTAQTLAESKLDAVAQNSYDSDRFGLSAALSNGRDRLPLPDAEAALIEQVVYTRVIEHWESQDDPEHLRTIRDRLLRKELQAPRLLGIYQTILTASLPHCEMPNHEIPIATNQAEVLAQTPEERRLVYDDSMEHLELLLSGLIGLDRGRLRVKNRIYETIFDISWVDSQLSALRPYAKQLTAWLNSNRLDESRLLRGKALKDAQAWSQERSVSEVDHDFLMASERYDRQVTQQALKSARLKEVEKRLALERKTRRRQRGWITALSAALGGAIILGSVARVQYQQARRTQLRALVTTAEALYSSDQRLEALLQALKAHVFFERLGYQVPDQLSKRLDTVLRTTAVEAVEHNQLTLANSNFWDVDIRATGDYIATASADHQVRLWGRDGELLQTLSGHKARVRTVAFFPYDSWLASGGDDRHIKLWTLDGQLVRTLRSHTDSVNGIAIAPNGQTLASASDDQSIKLWRKDGTLLQTFEGHRGPVLAVAFSPDGKTIASASEDRTIKIWRLDGQLLRTLEGHSEAVLGVDFSLSGQKLVSSSRDSTIKLWNLRSGDLIDTLRGHGGPVLSVAYSPDGKQIASSSRDTTVRLWNQKGEAIAVLEGHQSWVNRVRFSPDSDSLASASFDKTVRLWDLTNALQTRYIGPSESIVGVDISPDGLLIAAASDDHGLYLWHRKTGRLLRRINHTASVLSVAFSADGQSIVTGSWDGTARLWSLEGEQQAILSGQRKAVWDAAFSPDGQTVATGSADGKIRLWDRKGQMKNTFSGHNSEVRSVAFSPDGQRLVSASLDNSVKLWDTEGRLLRIFSGPGQNGFVDASFSPDGRLIAASGFDNTARIWTLDGMLVTTLAGHEAEVRSVRFSDDGQQLVTAGGDGQVRVWDLEGELVATLRGEGAAVWEAAFIEGDRTVLAAGESHHAWLWDLDLVLGTEGLVETGCEWIADYLENHPTASDSRDVCPD
ncbi:MAG: AAA-like domain-containing protein [Cyanobacteria bacterium J06607_13]